MTAKTIFIKSVCRVPASGEPESLEFQPGVNVIVGVKDTGKTGWLQTISYLLGDTDAPEKAMKPEIAAASDGTIPANGGPSDNGDLGLKDLVRRAAETVEREALKRMLERVRWRRIEAAQRLGISDKTLRDKIKHYGLDRSDL